MLVLTRKELEKLVIIHAGEELVISVVAIDGNRARIGFVGPLSFQVKREEIVSRVPGLTVDSK